MCVCGVCACARARISGLGLYEDKALLSSYWSSTAVSYLKVVLFISSAASDAPQHDSFDVNSWEESGKNKKPNMLTLRVKDHLLLKVTFSLRWPPARASTLTWRMGGGALCQPCWRGKVLHLLSHEILEDRNTMVTECLKHLAQPEVR